MEMRTFSNVYSKQWDIANINYVHVHQNGNQYSNKSFKSHHTYK